MPSSKSVRTILITGASGGVGSELCRHFHELGWSVLGITSRPNPKAEWLEIKADIKDTDIYDRLKEITPQIDVLVNNAGVFSCKPIDQCSRLDLDVVIDNNLKGTINMTMACLKLMNKGRIINIGSVAGTHGIENQALYCASKFGINGFFDALSHELTPKGILVSTINPGGIDTPLWHNHPYPGDKKELLKPSDIAVLVEYIACMPPHVVFKNALLHPSTEIH